MKNARVQRCSETFGYPALMPETRVRDRLTSLVAARLWPTNGHRDSRNGHEPGNIFIYAPVRKRLIVIDLTSPWDQCYEMEQRLRMA
jgi:hypothetical protein